MCVCVHVYLLRLYLCVKFICGKPPNMILTSFRFCFWPPDNFVRQRMHGNQPTFQF